MNNVFKDTKTKNIITLIIVIFLLPVFFVIVFLWVVLIDEFVDDLENGFGKNEDYNQISYTIPEYFEKDNNDIELYRYEEDSISCDLYIGARDRYDDFEYWFKSLAIFNLNDEVGEVTPININNNEALTLKIKRSSGTEYYYGFVASDYYYYIDYSIYDYSHGDSEESNGHSCYSALDQVLSSIEIK